MSEDSCKTDKKKGIVTGEVHALMNRTSDLEEIAGELGEKLSPILRPQGPEESDEKCQEIIHVPLAAEIEVNSGKVYRINSYLRDIIDRLEL